MENKNKIEMMDTRFMKGLRIQNEQVWSKRSKKIKKLKSIE